MKLLMMGVVTALSVLTYIISQRDNYKNAKTDEQKFFALDGLFKLHGTLNNVNWKWLKAISKVESQLGQDPRTSKGLVSYDGKSYGVMQIAEGLGSKNEIVIKGFGGPEKLNDPNYSIGQGAKLVSYLNSKYNGDMEKVFKSYNQGERWTDLNRDFTHGYANKVIQQLSWIENKEKEYSI